MTFILCGLHNAQSRLLGSGIFANILLEMGGFEDRRQANMPRSTFALLHHQMRLSLPLLALQQGKI